MIKFDTKLKNNGSKTSRMILKALTEFLKGIT